MELIERSLQPNSETQIEIGDPLSIQTKITIGESSISLNWTFECKKLQPTESAKWIKDQLLLPMSSMIQGLQQERQELVTTLQKREKELRDCLVLFQTYQPKVMPRTLISLQGC